MYSVHSTVYIQLYLSTAVYNYTLQLYYRGCTYTARQHYILLRTIMINHLTTGTPAVLYALVLGYRKLLSHTPMCILLAMLQYVGSQLHKHITRISPRNICKAHISIEETNSNATAPRAHHVEVTESKAPSTSSLFITAADASRWPPKSSATHRGGNPVY